MTDRWVVIERLLREAARHPHMDNTCKVRAQYVNEAADTIETLRAENARLTAARNECERQFQAKVDEIIVLLNERDVLREALKPFVRECNRLVAGYHRPENQMRPAITAGDLRAARAALGERE